MKKLLLICTVIFGLLVSMRPLYAAQLFCYCAQGNGMRMKDHYNESIMSADFDAASEECVRLCGGPLSRPAEVR